MCLIDLQLAMAKLYTDQSLRNNFLNTPQLTGIQLGLSDLEIKQLEASFYQINFFADSLKNKRMNEVTKFFHLSYSRLKNEFEELFDQYALTYLPSGIKKHQDDSEKFVNYINNIQTVNEDLKTLLNYELINFKMYNIKFCFKIKLFDRYLIDFLKDYTPQLLSRVDEKKIIYSKRYCIAIWIKFYPDGKLWHIVF
ncbi:MAG: hypothetical protein H7263_14035 [Candidatus Sericytochromatia bacterium]|nr:hypothetical protein [Candidatus Sericytochromatia bacterium]